MDTFERIEHELAELECAHFERLSSRVQWTPELASCASGSVQFFSIDDRNRGAGALPVVCVVGINYTQEPARASGGIVHYSGARSPSVTNGTATRRQPRFVIAAYNRNQSAWATSPTTDPSSPLLTYGAPNATLRSGLTGKTPDEIGPFILLMTNVTPFITLNAWQDQVRRTPDVCTALTGLNSMSHLDDLFDRLGRSIDLWIGHSAIDGTRWVWPFFAEFVRRRGIKEWLLCGNISARAHLWHDIVFRKPSHRLYEWYK